MLCINIKNLSDKIREKMKPKLFNCDKCNMKFESKIRLQRHCEKGHPPKKEQYTQKWYWENEN